MLFKTAVGKRRSRKGGVYEHSAKKTGNVVIEDALGFLGAGCMQLLNKLCVDHQTALSAQHDGGN